VPREHRILTDFPNFGYKEPRFEQTIFFSASQKGHFKMAASLLYYSTDRIVCKSANSDGFYFSESEMTKRKNSLTSSSLAIDIDPTLYCTVHCAHACLSSVASIGQQVVTNPAVILLCNHIQGCRFRYIASDVGPLTSCWDQELFSAWDRRAIS